MPELYHSLAELWPLVSAPEEYEEEAAAYRECLLNAGDHPARSVLELGCGGGSNAYYLKQHFDLVLTDVSADMLAHSRRLNPKCEHAVGDMRTLRLHRQFDRVFVHDAICYMTTAADLRQAITTAYVHCRPGGAALFVPDDTRETFRPETNSGGNDSPERSLRYLEWTWDPNPSDSSYMVDYVYVIRDATGAVRMEHDRHEVGLFSRSEWLQMLSDAGFQPELKNCKHSGLEKPLEIFLGAKPRL